ncbi:lysozyme inhibitor LprI family protein [Marinobacter sp. LN3S78]|uniref:lysozyme inhibitor LprI family protein n=1 Tax=Marinobacter sp. LN3S78 TaxID=3382300 RepID=UPI00387AFA32
MPGFLRPFALLTIALTSVACQAIDNPDAPHYLEDFRSEVSSHEQAVYEDAQTTSDSMEAFAESQRAWEAYQEAEKAFVSSVWTPRNFGSSSAFSRLAFYADVLRSRIELLLKYRKQF